MEQILRKGTDLVRNQLINIITSEDGKQLVSARDLYIGLGLNKSQWSRWYPVNIKKNDFFKENIDWIGVRHNVEGNETMDFAISLEFAKHIAMMARTDKSHQYRNYFIECEKRANDPYKNMSPELKSILMLDAKTIEIDNRVTKLENTMTIDYSQQEELHSLARKIVVQALGGKDTPAYKELNKKAFCQIWKDYKRILQVNSYKNTAVKDLVFAKKVLNDWKVPRELELMIKGANSQLRFEGDVNSI
ncbi:AntB [Clostridium baratii]|uniref:ORF6C domain-containing protein n=1 Tax=Clostridium baratii TaxID=1561 RepID=UPI0006C5A035|nr:ORF6C domain-containing protein [Clostridium baratii]CUO90948.1 AntB [Clostridium baratii]